jgi:putative MATE family efflux protein
MIIGIVCGLAFMAGVLSCGPILYGAMGATGETLRQATLYSNILFSGAVSYWLLMLMQSALRGAGNVKAPARIMMTSVGAALVLSPALIMGWFHLPKMGIAGAGAAQVSCNICALICMTVYMRSSSTNLRLRVYPLRAAQFRAILGVGLPSTLNAVMANLSLIALTGAAGMAGAAGIAGYGIAARLELLLIPMMFGFGTAVITIVGTNLGAGNVQRARHAALTNAFLVAAIVEVVGISAACMPQRWMGIFTHDPAVIEIGSHYLRLVGPMYGFIAVTTALYFAGQGARRIVWPIVGAFVRLLAALLAALSVSVWHVHLTTAFACVAIGALVSGVVSLVGFWMVRWEAR